MNEYSLTDMLHRIKTLKKEKKISNERLSEITGISLGTLSKILAGQTKEPSVESVIKIANGLNTSAEYLIFGIRSQLTDTEKQLLSAYRKNPEMQPAINKMLDLNNTSTIEQTIEKSLHEQINDAILSSKSHL